MRLTSIRLSPWGPKWCSVFADASPGLWEQRLHRRGQELPVNSHPGIFLEALTANKSRREEAGELVRPTMPRENSTVSAAEIVLQPPARTG